MRVRRPSGDPAADCAVVWQSLVGSPAPPLTAYDNALGGVAVIPSSQKPPAGWTPIASQNVALIELQESLGDPALTPVARGGILLWGRDHFGLPWFDAAERTVNLDAHESP